MSLGRLQFDTPTSPSRPRSRLLSFPSTVGFISATLIGETRRGGEGVASKGWGEGARNEKKGSAAERAA